eukprot:TRINITY_DN869_c0_g1_i1.p1 TRINITY_DN869_c0_g1~~TRINITY_DN869_c0_g1_i1.p1  ORF type:complete len:170 (-),score=8.81 TRINITY_DN869_c0_g1_i1:186-695(-)
MFIMDETGINDWELDILMRSNIVSDLQTVELSLKNIYAMIDKVSQLPIKVDVASLITDAVHAFHEALTSCNHNRNYIECIQWTKHSNYLAKKQNIIRPCCRHSTFLLSLLMLSTLHTFCPDIFRLLLAVFTKKLRQKYNQWRSTKAMTIYPCSLFISNFFVHLREQIRF